MINELESENDSFCDLSYLCNPNSIVKSVIMTFDLQ